MKIISKQYYYYQNNIWDNLSSSIICYCDRPIDNSHSYLHQHFCPNFLFQILNQKHFLTCFELLHFTLRHVAHAVNGDDADVVGEAAHEVGQDAGLGVCGAVGLVFLHAESLDDVGVCAAAGLPLHPSYVAVAVQTGHNVFRRTGHWEKRVKLRTVAEEELNFFLLLNL